MRIKDIELGKGVKDVELKICYIFGVTTFSDGKSNQRLVCCDADSESNGETILVLIRDDKLFNTFQLEDKIKLVDGFCVSKLDAYKNQKKVIAGIITHS